MSGATTGAATLDLDELARIAGAVPDPELPPITVADLGILRSVDRRADGTIVATVTPTYSGCPAVEVIEHDIRAALLAAGCGRVEVVRALSPAWTTDWITDEGRRKLVEAGIAPPGAAGERSGPVAVQLGRRPAPRPVPCPRCGSGDTAQISPFGSTACKALHRCNACAEPFDRFKEL